MFQRGLIHDSYGLRATAPRFGMRTEDDRVPSLYRDNAFEQNGGGGIRNRSKRKQDSDGLGQFQQIPLGQLANHADGALIFDIVIDKLTGHHILDDLVFHHAESGLLNRQASKMLSLFQSN